MGYPCSHQSLEHGEVAIGGISRGWSMGLLVDFGLLKSVFMIYAEMGVSHVDMSSMRVV